MKTLDRANWHFEYSVEVNEIDIQHRELMNMLNDMINHSADDYENRKKYFYNIMETASSHLANHFDTEERVLGKTSYDMLEEHKNEHKKLISRVTSLRDGLGKINEEIALYDLTATLKEYFLSHIIMFDKEAKEYFKTGSRIITHSGFQAGIF